MPTLINKPTTIEAAGNKTKIIQEYVGRVNSETSDVSVAYMCSPSGWIEPAQTPKFDEYTIVLKGSLRVEFDNSSMNVEEGQGVIVYGGEKVRYSTPGSEGAEYIAVCTPAFSQDTVTRDPE